MISVDLAGQEGLTESFDPRYAQERRPASYTVRAKHRPRLIVERRDGQISLRDPVTGHTATGVTYLDALRALSRSRRGAQ